MAETVKVLGQANPAATTLTDLYAVPASTSAVVSSVVVCNQDAGAGTYRIAVAVANAADNAKQYLAFDAAIASKTTVSHVLGITLAATDEIRVYASNANMSFNAFGTEIT